ncbi:MAG: hypothetical protein ACAI25_05475, partial [Planctomycetota bacterium]
MTVEVERPERSIGAAAVTGAVKGAVAGVLLTASALLLARLVVGRGLTVTSAELAVVASIVGGGALAGASFCGLDAAAARVTNKLAALGLRIAAGLVAPIAAASPWYGLGGGAFESALSTRELQAFGMFALSLAAGQVAAGHPDELPHEPQGCGRLARAGMAAPLAFVLAMFLARAHGDICGEGFSASLGGLVCAGAFWVAQAAAAPVARRVARSLEPELMAD